MGLDRARRADPGPRETVIEALAFASFKADAQNQVTSSAPDGGGRKHRTRHLIPPGGASACLPGRLSPKSAFVRGDRADHCCSLTIGGGLRPPGLRSGTSEEACRYRSLPVLGQREVDRAP